MKREDFFKFLIARYEQIHHTTGKKVAYFNSKGVEVEDKEAKWYVSDGIVYDNEEKVSTKQAKYSANLGVL